MTQLLILGGTGFTGSHVATEALKRAYDVVSVSRNAPTEPIGGVKYRTGNATDFDELVAASNVVVGALSPRAGSEGTLIDTYATIAHQAAAGDTRFIVVGGFSSLRPAAGEPTFVEAGQVPEEFAPEAVEMDSVRTWLIDNAPQNLDWLFISPAGEYGGYLPQDGTRGTYRSGTNVALFDEDGKSTITGADFALAIVDQIADQTDHRTQLTFAY